MRKDNFYEEEEDILRPAYQHCVVCGSDVDLAMALLRGTDIRVELYDGEYLLCEPCRRSREYKERWEQ